MVYVTHDQKEALALAGRLAVMDKGRVVQVGAPAEVYRRPANRFVAGFLGDSNFLPGKVREHSDGRCVVDTAVGPLTVAVAPGAVAAPGAAVVCSVRPQALGMARDGEGNRIPATVGAVAFLGDVVQVRLAAAAGTALELVTLPQHAGGLTPGAAVVLTAPPEQVVVLPDGG
jgi:ABC-type Fe3+/spermidine/putrescine transport system ATPase subunit